MGGMRALVSGYQVSPNCVGAILGVFQNIRRSCSETDILCT
jgi:hypothetical protein